MDVLLMPDVQYPDHDPDLLDSILDFASDLQPAKIVLIGDGPDFKEVSRWSKGTAEEYKETLGDNIIGFRRDVLVPLRQECPRADIEWVEGNHCKRIADFTRQYGLEKKAGNVLFSPVFSKIPSSQRDASNCQLDPRVLAEWILEDALDVRLGLQIHKFIWEPATKGV